jgi:hypothetical protein
MNTKPINGFPGYLVSDCGKVVSEARRVRGKVGTRVHFGRVLIQGMAGKRRNYACVKLSANGVALNRRVHQLVAEAFIGPRPEGHDVDHIDGNTRNNSLANLRYLPLSENRAHRHGR